MDGSPDLHVIFGWLEVGEILPVTTARRECLIRHPWIADHPHVARPEHDADPGNTLYLSSERSRYAEGSCFGAGRFSRFLDALCLTGKGQRRSVWSLPRWFLPAAGRPPLSYHRRPERGSTTQEGAVLQTVGRGQEFVLDVDVYPEAEAWIAAVVRSGLSWRKGKAIRFR